ncbi:MAG TPA: lipid-A-disaccharide synthase [Candidatus Omnitrophota bacterium]|nr:lipid-A-disaccharide synthase [Candidatus Omnitrophota bacterium]MDD4940372.1 lipid-A-disaccharide synthase [Candidatus Omnitrophota bacterium]HNQ50952.1 lipid-A-disaccharide synthase [Candidatus Omnitrophota bacterium]HQO37982.1 lipid-A-disaccharide synthase [Candidatus Omnitrophota bacterium]
MEKTKTVLIIAGEASGDQHAANLVKEIKRRDTDIRFWGLGGARLKDAGVDVRADLVSCAVIGFFEVLKHLGTIRSVYKRLLSDIDARKPDAAILVDYPGFNLHLAKDLKKRGIPVMYYISPQIWAWGKGRIRTIRETVGLMIVLFPFEEALYRAHNVPVVFVGHPCLDHVRPRQAAEDFRKTLSLEPSRLTVSLLPGSRTKEIKTLLPVMLDAAAMIKKTCPAPVEFLVLAAPSVPRELIDGIAASHTVPVKIVHDRTYDGIAASDLCLVCSGTATLETGILGTPMIILYKVNFLTWLYMRMLIRIPYIGLVNVVAGRKIAEEFIQFDAAAPRIASYCTAVLRDADKRASLRRELAMLKNALGSPGAGGRAAEAVIAFLRQTRGK